MIWKLLFNSNIILIMKKILAFLMCSLLLSGVVSAQSKQEIKEAEKVAKVQAKQLSKDGWKLLESGTLESVLKNHYLKKKTADVEEIVGTANRMRSINLGKTTARNNAMNEYAESAKSMIRGRITTDIRDIDESQVENLVSGYERLVLKEINGEVKSSYTLYKENKDGKYDVRGYFLVDQDSASKARKRAMELALEESELAHKYGNEISNFIDEGFNKLK